MIIVSYVGRQTDRLDDSTTAVGGAPSHDASHDYRAGGVVTSDGGSLEEQSQVTDGRADSRPGVLTCCFPPGGTL